MYMQGCAGAADEVPGVRERAAAGAHGSLLPPAGDARRLPHRRGLRRVGERARVPGRSGAVDPPTGRGLEADRRRRPRQRCRLLRPALAHRPGLPLRFSAIGFVVFSFMLKSVFFFFLFFVVAFSLVPRVASCISTQLFFFFCSLGWQRIVRSSCGPSASGHCWLQRMFLWLHRKQAMI